MTAQDLLITHPKSKEIAREWFTTRLTKSLREDPTLHPEYVAEMIRRGIPDNLLITILDDNPHSMFEMLDEKGITVNIISSSPEFRNASLPPSFAYRIINYNDKDYEDDYHWYESRKEAEKQALIKSLDLLEGT